ncbi:hypothetical protein DB32_004725 [Sandaracinus amylolyticus]|uniref:Phosphatidic acid phosphatase type 2/haloperoxidase domain-containing protein n=1 Tax=Sandaracinus amylolyticus TaxID=927083 RepID=A0A0F6YJW1_9BACT|nr:hypothetical protein DB32_004725 [Sandaracinus amylolyticus]
MLCVTIVPAMPIAAQDVPRDPAPQPATETQVRTPISPVAPYAAGLAVWATALGIGLYEAPWSNGRVDAGWADAALVEPVIPPLDELDDIDRDEATLRTISDGTLVGTMLYTQLIDIVLVPLIQGDVHLVWQATSAHFLALGTSLSIDAIAKHATSRERPYGQRLCPDHPDLPQCNNDDLYASFFSGHTALSFTSAGTSCALHLSRGLYGNLAADIIGCAIPVAGAATTGALRVASDSHYVTDVLVGMTVGFVSGYLITLGVVPSRVRVPVGEVAQASSDFTWAVVPTASVSHEQEVVRTTVGAAATGTF